jgi:hypothetical protein
MKKISKCFHSIMLAIVLSLASFESYRPVIAAPVSSAQNLKRYLDEPLCGVNVLYLTEGILTGASPDYLKLAKRFPNLLTEGIAFGQLRIYLEEKGYFCRLEKMKRTQFSKLDTGLVGIVLSEATPFSHVYLAIPLGGGKIQIYDSPFPVRNITPGEDEKPVFILVVSKSKNAFWAFQRVAELLLFVVFLLIGIFLTFRGIHLLRRIVPLSTNPTENGGSDLPA